MANTRSIVRDIVRSPTRDIVRSGNLGGLPLINSPSDLNPLFWADIRDNSKVFEDTGSNQAEYRDRVNRVNAKDSIDDWQYSDDSDAPIYHNYKRGAQVLSDPEFRVGISDFDDLSTNDSSISWDSVQKHLSLNKGTLGRATAEFSFTGADRFELRVYAVDLDGGSIQVRVGTTSGGGNLLSVTNLAVGQNTFTFNRTGTGNIFVQLLGDGLVIGVNQKIGFVSLNQVTTQEEKHGEITTTFGAALQRSQGGAGLNTGEATLFMVIKRPPGSNFAIYSANDAAQTGFIDLAAQFSLGDNQGAVFSATHTDGGVGTVAELTVPNGNTPYERAYLLIGTFAGTTCTLHADGRTENQAAENDSVPTDLTVQTVGGVVGFDQIASFISWGWFDRVLDETEIAQLQGYWASQGVIA